MQDSPSEESSDTDHEREEEGRGIPVATPSARDALNVPPVGSALSTSPSSRSSTSAASSASSPLTPGTPPSGSLMTSAKSQPGKLWRKLAGKLEVESEKENKRDPVRRKARDTQKRLRVGKPRVAGGAGARAVTRIIPSRGSATSTSRTRSSRVDPVEEAARMEVVIEEEPGALCDPTSCCVSTLS